MSAETPTDVAVSGTGTNALLTGSAVIASAFLVSVSMGFNVVLIPTRLADMSVSESLIGALIALDGAAGVATGFGVSLLARRLGIVPGQMVSTALAVTALLLLAQTQSLAAWGALIFTIGFGAAAFCLYLQTWLAQLHLGRHRGLVTGLLGTSMSLGLAAGPTLFSLVERQGERVGELLVRAAEAMGLADPMARATAQTAAELTAKATAQGPFVVSATVAALAVVPVVLVARLAPRLAEESAGSVLDAVREAPVIMFAVMMSGATYIGIASFITIYGLRNELGLAEAALLLTAFNLGALFLEALFAWISDFFDRQRVLVAMVFTSMCCAVYLPMAIYTDYRRWVLLFLWGGVVGGMYSISLTMTALRFTGARSVVGNAAHATMESMGAMIGPIIVGVAMHIFGSDGLPYAILLISVLYYLYVLSQHEML